MKKDSLSKHSNKTLSDFNNLLGHRKRVKNKFLENYTLNSSFSDYELLEMLLFYSIPRKDVKPIAKELLNKYGSLADILASKHENIAEIKNITDNTTTLLILVKAITSHLLKQKIIQQPILSNWEALLDYCYAKISHEKKELVKILYLNTKNILIKDEVMHEGTINYSPIHSREILKRSLELGATSYILVHNHPSGNPNPSSSDIKVTLDLAKTTAAVDIHLHDHIIIAKNGIISLKKLGLI